MRVHGVVAILLLADFQIPTVAYLRLSSHADGYVGPTVKSIDCIRERPGQWIDLGNRHGKQFASAAILERVQHCQSQCVVDITTDVCVEDQSNWTCQLTLCCIPLLGYKAWTGACDQQQSHHANDHFRLLSSDVFEEFDQRSRA